MDTNRLAHEPNEATLLFTVVVNADDTLTVSDPANEVSVTLLDPNLYRAPSSYPEGSTPATELGRVIGAAVAALVDLSA